MTPNPGSSSLKSVHVALKDVLHLLLPTSATEAGLKWRKFYDCGTANGLDTQLRLAQLHEMCSHLAPQLAALHGAA